MFNLWSFAKYPEKNLISFPSEEIIGHAGRLILTEMQLIVLCENGFEERFRLKELTAVRLYQKSGANRPVTGFIVGLLLILSFGMFGYYFIPRLLNFQDPIVVGEFGNWPVYSSWRYLVSRR